MEPIKLTAFSHGSGCACKLGPDELAQVLAGLENTVPTDHPDLLVGIDGSDDAGVYRMSQDLAIVQSVDYFTPIVNEAWDWGRIAATNALSDIYAMGGQPLTALQIVGWPRDTLSLDLLSEVIAGGSAVMAEAGCTLVGGHSLDDPEPKYGLAVTGVVHPDKIVTNAAAQPGDHLVLTKPIGTGVIATAIKRGNASVDIRDAAVEVMVSLNAGAAEAMLSLDVKAATDVTGFGLLGHLGEVLRASSVGAVIESGTVPFIDGAVDLAVNGNVAGGTKRNLAHAEQFTDFGSVDEATRTLLADAQTSGGLLIAVVENAAASLVSALAERHTLAAATIGRIVEGPPKISIE
jgi:selenide,water dikinase